MDLNELEETSHSAGGIFKTLMERYKDAAKGRADVRIVIDSEWRVVRAHITAPRGHKLAGQLLTDHSGWFDLNDLHLARHVTWEPAELAVCEALLDPRGRRDTSTATTRAASTSTSSRRSSAPAACPTRGSSPATELPLEPRVLRP